MNIFMSGVGFLAPKRLKIDYISALIQPKLYILIKMIFHSSLRLNKTISLLKFKTLETCASGVEFLALFIKLFKTSRTDA